MERPEWSKNWRTICTKSGLWESFPTWKRVLIVDKEWETKPAKLLSCSATQSSFKTKESLPDRPGTNFKASLLTRVLLLQLLWAVPRQHPQVANTAGLEVKILPDWDITKKNSLVQLVPTTLTPRDKAHHRSQLPQLICLKEWTKSQRKIRRSRERNGSKVHLVNLKTAIPAMEVKAHQRKKQRKRKKLKSQRRLTRKNPKRMRKRRVLSLGKLQRQPDKLEELLWRHLILSLFKRQHNRFNLWHNHNKTY